MAIGRHVSPSLKLVRLIGEGGMGTVWAAEHQVLRSQVAVKMLAQGYIEDEKSIARFKQEAQRAAKVRSPHVATIFDHGMTAEKEPYIVMELLEGETLGERIKRLGCLPLHEIETIIGQTAKALTAAHKLGVVHRDIKPSNLFLLDNEGELFVKVLDFGIAKQMDVPPDLTTSSMLVGTPAYMSPEQYMQPKSVDLRTDLWALGVVVYEALTGKRPFTGETPMAVALAITKGKYRAATEIRTELPKALDGWMKRALAVEAEARHGSAMESINDLLSALRPPSTRPNRITTIPPIGPADEYAATLLKPALNANPPPAEASMAEAEGPPTIVDGPKSFERLLRENSPEIEEQRRFGMHSVRLGGSPANAMALDHSGKWLFASSVNGRVMCIDLTTNQTRWSYQLVGAQPINMTMTGGWLAISCSDGIIRVFKPDRGILHGKLPIIGGCRDFALSFDGVDCVAITADGQLIAWNIHTGRRRNVTQKPSNINCVAFHPKFNGWITSNTSGDTFAVWDESLRQVKSLDLAGSPICALAAAPTGSEAAIGRTNGGIMILDVATGKTTVRFAGHTQKIKGLSFFLRGTTLASASLDGTGRYWDVSTGKLLGTIGNQKRQVECIATSTESSRLGVSFHGGLIRAFGWPMVPSVVHD